MKNEDRAVASLHVNGNEMVLLIDNYDSFTYNLAHRLGELGAMVRVVRNDAVSLADIERLAPERIVISPGPGRPETAGVSVDVLRRFAPTVPILGVCLGHQALAIAFGGRVDRAGAPMHGKTSMVAHEAAHLFAGLAQPFEAGRYHSLVVAHDAVPTDFVVSAWVETDRTVMGLRHVTWPVYGVQFHPESVLTPVGHRLLQNFLDARAPKVETSAVGRAGTAVPGANHKG
jgi:anthranilate synthase component II